MAGVNKVILVGYLGADPELRQTQGGAVANLRVATTEKWTTQDGEKKERTEWHNVVVWGRMAEHCQRYLSKGSPVYVEGSLQSRTYNDQEGKERRTWDVRANTIQFLGGGGGEGQGDTPRQGGGQRQGGGNRGGQSGWGGGGGGGWDQPSSGQGFDDDDPIPF